MSNTSENGSRLVLTVVRKITRATITLHNPFVNFGDANNVSSRRCVDATRSILAAYYRLSETSLDISRLHPFVTVSNTYFSVRLLFY